MFIQRLLLERLLRWKNNKNRKPLLLKGVRQVGKTSLVKYFGKKEFEDLAYFNFEEQPQLCQFFQSSKTPERILENLSLVHGRKIFPQKTLIVFDEIQECNEALNSLKYFCEQMPQYAIIGLGSLLGVTLATNQSFPVGKVDFLTLYPLTFAEFLSAAEHNLYEYLANYNSLEPLPDLFFDQLKEKLIIYYITGGMPEAVSKYLETQDFQETQKVLRNIENAYRLDFSKHIKPNDIPKVGYIWDSLPSQLAKENRKFIYSVVKKGARARDYETALLWLKQAGMINIVYLASKPAFPLKAYSDLTAFKVYAFDVGILNHIAGLTPDFLLSDNNPLTEFKGAMAENFVLQSLIASTQQEFYYWTSGNQAEVDFLWQRRTEIIPIEVKASANVRSKSLLVYAQKYTPKLKLRFSLQNISYKNGLLNLPLFMVDFADSFIENILSQD